MHVDSACFRHKSSFHGDTPLLGKTHDIVEHVACRHTLDHEGIMHDLTTGCRCEAIAAYEAILGGVAANLTTQSPR
eukprot:scaffold284099_cov25-Prasinocladus_malaysianus.AAC.1